MEPIGGVYEDAPPGMPPMPPPMPPPIPPYCGLVSKYSPGFFIAPLGSACVKPVFYPTTLAALYTVVLKLVTTEKMDDDVDESAWELPMLPMLPMLCGTPTPPIEPLPGPT